MSIDCRALPHDLVKLLHDTDKNVHRLLSSVHHTSYSDVSKRLNHSTNSNINSFMNNSSSSSKDDVNTSPLQTRNKHDRHVPHLRHSSTTSEEMQIHTQKYKSRKQKNKRLENGTSVLSNKSLVERRRERLRTQIPHYMLPEDDANISNDSSYEFEEEMEYIVEDEISSYEDDEYEDGDEDNYKSRKQPNLERRTSEVAFSNSDLNSSISSTNTINEDDTADFYDEIDKSSTNINQKYAPERMHKNRVSEQVRKLHTESTPHHRSSQLRPVHERHAMHLSNKTNTNKLKHGVQPNKRMYKLEDKMHSQFGKRWGRKFDAMLSQRAANSIHENSDNTTKQSNNENVNEFITSMNEHIVVSVNENNNDIGNDGTAAATKAKEENKLAVALVTTDSNNNENHKSSDNWSVAIANDPQELASLREELRRKEEMILELKLAKAQEVALLRETITNVKAEAIQETTAQLTSSFKMKESLLEAKLKNEQEKLERLMKELTSEQEIRAKHERQLQEKANEINTLTGQITVLKSEIEKARGHVSAIHKELQYEQQRVLQLEQSVHQLQEKKNMLSTENNSLQLELTNLTERLLDKEKNTNETMRKFEAEFTDTSSQYQILLSEATTKMTYLEGVQRKYKSLKEKFQLLEAEKVKLEHSHKEFEETSTQRVTELQNELVRAKKEHDECMIEHLSEVATLHDTINKLKLSMEDTQTHYANEKASMQLELSELNQNVQERNAQIATLQTELTSECNARQQLVVQNAESQLKTSNELAQLRQSSASYKVRAEEIISSLKRQLREKDVKLQALLATSTEPLQKLRSQLEDERGKRALAEDQLTRHKKQAKAAEEAILRELRKEQLRGTFTHNSSWISSKNNNNNSMAESAVGTTNMNGESNTKLSVFATTGGKAKISNKDANEVRTPTTNTITETATIQTTSANKNSNSTLFALPGNKDVNTSDVISTKTPTTNTSINADNENTLPRTWTDQARRLASNKQIFAVKNVLRVPPECRRDDENKDINIDMNKCTQTSRVTLPQSDDTIDSDNPPRTQETLINESHHKDEAHECNKASITSANKYDGWYNNHSTTITAATVKKESEANATPSNEKLNTNKEEVCVVLPEQEVANSPALTIRDLSHISPASPCKSDVSSENNKLNSNEKEDEEQESRRSNDNYHQERQNTQEYSYSSEEQEEEEPELHEIAMTESNKLCETEYPSNIMCTHVTRADIITPLTQTESFNKSSEAILPYLPSQRTPHPHRKRPSPFTNSPSAKNSNSHVSTSPSYAPQSTARSSSEPSSPSYSSSSFLSGRRNTQEVDQATNTNTPKNNAGAEALRSKHRTNTSTAPLARLTEEVMPLSSQEEEKQQDELNVELASVVCNHEIQTRHDANNAASEDNNVNIADTSNNVNTNVFNSKHNNNDSANDVKFFQANATQVLNKITSSREAFLQQCAAIIRQSTSSC